MHKITHKDIYEGFLLALRLCSSDILKLSDSDLEDTILEDLDIAYTDFYEGTLNYLLETGEINSEIRESVLSLRDKIKSVIDIDQKRNANAFRNDSTWQEIYSLSDNILSSLQSRHNS